MQKKKGKRDSDETDPRYHIASGLIGAAVFLNISRVLGLLTLPAEVHSIIVGLLGLSGTIVLIFARPANLSQKNRQVWMVCLVWDRFLWSTGWRF
jgi:hypothetical protein